MQRLVTCRSQGGKPFMKKGPDCDCLSLQATHINASRVLEMLRKESKARVCQLDVSILGDSSHSIAHSAVIGMSCPLEKLHTEVAAQLRESDYVMILPDNHDERRAWQAWVRLTKVFGLKQVAILSC